jgi:transposase
MKNRQKLLNDEQWELIEPLLPEPRLRRDRRGRPWASNRACFEGILWILQTGAAWRVLPEEFPSSCSSAQGKLLATKRAAAEPTMEKTAVNPPWKSLRDSHSSMVPAAAGD